MTASGFTPFTLGTEAFAAVVQTDDAEYVEFTGDGLPGMRVLTNGQSSLAFDGARWLTVGTVGRGVAAVRRPM